jgi:protein phosphatase
MLGDGVKTYYQSQNLLGDRFLVVYPQVVLDTKPAIPPQSLEDPPSFVTPYLRLFPYRLHTPQVFGYLPSPDPIIPDLDIWFLEYSSVPLDDTGELSCPELLPKLAQVWSAASPLRQLNWLWQIAQLWQPLQGNRVVTTLLNPRLIRANEQIIQLLELDNDGETAPKLSQLAQSWSQLLPTTENSLKNFLSALCEDIRQERIVYPDQLVSTLENALQHYGNSLQRHYQVFTCTDTGPLREHNEDACYPLTEAPIEPDSPLAIVCDGIGGQEGGEIASQLAIDTLESEIDRLIPPADGQDINQALQEAICSTNDVISERNDTEQRQERQRMGTTLVMSLAREHLMYVAHVGDSRIYLVTENNCHQITVDDDLASREVRLGYLLYRDAIQYPNAGALVQALGMSSSAGLHPTVDKVVLDQDSVFLLCSDGLSDYDRVEQYWQTEISPLLRKEKTVEEVGRRLLQLANEKNGHDNSTIALVHCRIQQKVEQVIPLEYAAAEGDTIHPDLDHPFLEDPTQGERETLLDTPTLLPETPVTDHSLSTPSSEISKGKRSTLILSILAIAVLTAIGGLGWQWWLNSSNPINPDPNLSPTSPK